MALVLELRFGLLGAESKPEQQEFPSLQDLEQLFVLSVVEGQVCLLEKQSEAMFQQVWVELTHLV